MSSIISVCQPYRTSASCTHVSAILHALVSINPASLTSLALHNVDENEVQEDTVPVTSKLCKCISFLLDPSSQCSTKTKGQASVECQVPDDATLRETTAAFKKSLSGEIELKTQEQRLTSLWYSVRQYRITIFHRKDSTPPGKLVLQLIQRKSFSTIATRYGIKMEPLVIQAYMKYQHENGNPDLTVTLSGFHISASHPFLGATPDGSVYDPQCTNQPFGFLEVKCPFSSRDLEPVDACNNPGFFSTINQSKEGHAYFSQVLSQMAIGNRPWCDFVVFTQRGISVQRIKFNDGFWLNKRLPKLETFYDNCLLPELVSPIHALGLPVRDLRDTSTV